MGQLNRLIDEFFSMHYQVTFEDWARMWLQEELSIKKRPNRLIKIFAVLLFFTLTILAIFILRKKRPDIERPYKAFGYPVIPAMYILTTLSIMIILLIYYPNYTFPGLAIVLLGIPVFFLWRKFNKNGVEMQKSELDS